MKTAILPHAEVHADGRVAAWADSELVPTQDGNDVRIRLQVAGGHQPPWARRLLLHDALDRAASAHACHVMLTAPLGDPEILALIRERCTGVTTRSAGATCLIEADLPIEPLPSDFAQPDTRTARPGPPVSLNPAEGSPG
jgi:hypothetical protein